ncbi:hypothetical protein N7539_000932 [Penicillium diatomitis]|uniref:Uncharacterized protein n=1 Tax=Penicillium diatomitis TaxID=2819901 RepID=A0A9W9XMM4_9EURO|nr:uncharacterized protein N7539_000932 [Penicillium diatomitis]KAJ5495816.1 hypothetical protein N7539_000932 [Penicillium diatomitis]
MSPHHEAGMSSSCTDDTLSLQSLGGSTVNPASAHPRDTFPGLGLSQLLQNDDGRKIAMNGRVDFHHNSRAIDQRDESPTTIELRLAPDKNLIQIQIQIPPRLTLPKSTIFPIDMFNTKTGAPVL